MKSEALGLPKNHPLLWYATEIERKRGARAEYDEEHGWIVVDGNHRWALRGNTRVDLNNSATKEEICSRPSCNNRYLRYRKDQTTCGAPRCRQWASRQKGRMSQSGRPPRSGKGKA